MKQKKKMKNITQLNNEVDKTFKNLEKSYIYEFNKLKDKLNMSLDIIKKRDLIWCPKYTDNKFNELPLNSWFSIKESSIKPLIIFIES